MNQFLNLIMSPIDLMDQLHVSCCLSLPASPGLHTGGALFERRAVVVHQFLWPIKACSEGHQERNKQGYASAYENEPC